MESILSRPEYVDTMELEWNGYFADDFCIQNMMEPQAFGSLFCMKIAHAYCKGGNIYMQFRGNGSLEFWNNFKS